MDPILLISGAVFLAVVAAVGAVVFFVTGGASRAEDRLEVITGKRAREETQAGIMKEDLLGQGMAGVSSGLSSMFGRFANMKQFFEQADSPIKADAFFAISAGLGVLGAVVSLVFHVSPMLLPVSFLTPASLPLLWLWWRRRGRFKSFARQLPDALELIARALRSGHSLASGLHVVVEEMPAPISTEFAIAYEEQNLGIPLEAALKHMLERMPNMDLKFFVTAVVIQRTAGGDMAEILDKIGYIIRERFKIIGQVQALTGEGRISGVVLMALPIALFFAVLYLNPDYVMLLFTEELGRKMIGVAAFLQVLGAISIKKIIAIKV